MSSGEKLNILNLSATQAKKFFLEAKNYCSLDLPKYINFQELLKKISTEMKDNNYKQIKDKDKNPENYDDINYILFSNKDGSYDWRPYQIINPVMYISLVNEITKEENWNKILERFKKIDSNSYIKCECIPVVESSENLLNKKSSQILNWWDKIEQNSIKLALEYDYLFQTDIVNCYSEIYTHSIAWALHTREIAKNDRRNNELLGNIIDKHLQNMSYGQTNGIPQGSVLMDFIAEILLKYAENYPNSGSISKEITKIREKMEKKNNFSKDNIEVLISIVIEIIYKNPRVYVEGNAILSYLFPQIEDKSKRKEIIEKVFNKLKKVLNSGYFEIWFQRATLKESELNIEYNEDICKLVNNEAIKLWNISWIGSNKIKKIFEKIKIINQDEKEGMPQKIDKEEIKIFDEYNN